MIRTTFLTIILTFIMIHGQWASAQKSSYETNGGMTIGFGMGASYQQSDIANSSGGGFDFTLGSYIYKRENAFLSVDWKFRFLTGENAAHDHRINTDMTFSNVKYTFFNYDAEIGLTLNSLRERTRIVVTGFMGAGITHGRTFTDIYNADGVLYDYTVINTNQEKELIYTELLTLSDRDYETVLVNKAAVLPTAGLFIGYQFSRSFSLGIEHKTSFSFTEHNSMTGIDIDNRILTGSGIDMNHYTSLSFKWNLGGGGSLRRNSFSSYNYPSPVSRTVNSVVPPLANPERTVADRSPVTVVTATTSNSSTISNVRDNVRVTNNRPPATPLPLLRFLVPSSQITVERNVFGIDVQTEYVNAWQDITVKVNDVIITNYNFSNDSKVTTNIALREGLNTVVVRGKNEYGTGEAQAYITYVKPVTATMTNNEVSVITEFHVAEPEVVEPEVTEPVIVEFEIEGSDVVEPEVIEPVVAEPVVVEPEIVEPEIIEPVVAEPVVVEPVVVEPEIVEPEIIEPEVIEQVVAEPVIVEPEIVEPEVVEPEVIEQEVAEPDIIEPEVIEPVVAEPVIVEPEIVEPEIIEPVVAEPVVVEPVVVEPEIVEPEIIEPEVIEQEVAEPEIIEPEVIEQEVAEPDICGTRINPGNSTWQFCMITPNGTITRDNLTDENFSYSGPASSLFFMPIGGGSGAIVNGKPYSIKSGQYYLFTGNLTLTVSTKNPSSMGHWSVCIKADKEPVSGNGNNRPVSPCEELKVESLPGNSSRRLRSE